MCEITVSTHPNDPVVLNLGRVYTGSPKPAADFLMISKDIWKENVVLRKEDLFCMLI